MSLFPPELEEALTYTAKVRESTLPWVTKYDLLTQDSVGGTILEYLHTNTYKLTQDGVVNEKEAAEEIKSFLGWLDSRIGVDNWPSKSHF